MAGDQGDHETRGGEETDRVKDLDLQLHHLDDFHENGQAAWDDITGTFLDPGEVRKARMTEGGIGRRLGRRRSEAFKEGLEIIKIKWIDINKGDDKNLIYRSRFVGKESNDGEVGGFFAGASPL